MTNDKREALIADPNAGTRALVIPAEDGRVLLAIRSDGTVTGEVEDAGEAGARFVAYLREHVFVQAHTPTDDEREALVDAIWRGFDRKDYYGETPSQNGVEYGAEEILAAGFRRPVQGEPDLSVHVEAVAYADDIAEGVDVPDDYERHYCDEDGEDWPCTAVQAVQGEPTDAQVVAAMNALNGYEPPVTDISYWSGGYADAMRAALRAAAAATQNGSRDV